MVLHGKCPIATLICMLCLFLSCSSKTALDARGAKKLAIQELAERGYDTGNYQVTVKFDKEDNEFIVFFERQPSQIACHTLVRVNSETGEVTVWGGE
ncbi:MAG: hypothetical protein ACYC6Y_10515 [Thermoguttaceae bacterium]